MYAGAVPTSEASASRLTCNDDGNVMVSFAYLATLSSYMKEGGMLCHCVTIIIIFGFLWHPPKMKELELAIPQALPELRLSLGRHWLGNNWSPTATMWSG